MEQRLYRHTRTRSLPLQHRGVVSLRIRLSSSRISTWLSRWFGQVTRMRPIAVIACAYSGAVRCAGVHKHGMSNDKLCKRYLFNLEMIVKGKAAANKKIEGPPRMLYLRELYASIHHIFKEQVLAVVRARRSAPTAAPAAHPPAAITKTRVRFCSSTNLWAPHITMRGRENSAHARARTVRPAPLTLLPRTTRRTRAHPPSSQSTHSPARAPPTSCMGTAHSFTMHTSMRTNASRPAPA